MQDIRIILFVLLLSAGAQAECGTFGVRDEMPKETGGFVTEKLNRALTHVLGDSMQQRQTSKQDLLVSVPKLGAYYIGGYKYSDRDGEHGGKGFTTRLIRAYVDGTVLRHVAYRIQMELQHTVHMKDAYIEYQQFKQARLKLGQFKRPFTFENPLNPWDVGFSDYSQLSKYFSGFNDYTASEYNGSNGGRDIGLQLQGDILPVCWGGNPHALIRYQGGIFNGQGINTSDANGGKDFIGNIQFQPIKNLYIGIFGWTGSYSKQGLTAFRRRVSTGIMFKHKGWTLRTEYVMHSGRTWEDLYRIRQLQGGLLPDKRVSLETHAQAAYLVLGVPITSWLQVYGKWDSYMAENSWSHRQDIYALCPNIRPHKNLMLQAEWNIVRSPMAKIHHELWCMAYIRF